MLAESSEKEPQTDGSPICECGKETFGCSIHPTTREAWIASQRDSLVRILAALGSKPGSAKEREVAFTGKCSESLMWLDPDTCSWKMSPPSSKKSGYKPSSKTLPRAGMMCDGRVYLHQQPVPRTTVIAGGVLRSIPTPTVAGNYNRKGVNANSGDGLATWAKMWPTPNASDATKWSNQTLSERQEKGQQIRLSTAVSPQGGYGGQLNPIWAEWLMNWPLGWTQVGGKLNRKSEESRSISPTEQPESKPSAMAKCPSKLRSRG